MRNWDDIKKSILGLYNAGFSLRYIADRFDTTPPTINKYLSRWGIIRRGSEKMRFTGKKRKTSVNYFERRFGKLKVMGKDPILYPTRWICRCDCGKILRLKEIQLSKKTSCGCDR